MDKKWHVEHADGREWTTADLALWALDHSGEGLIYCDMEGFLVDEYGDLWIADECGNVCYVGEPDDMRVVWDS